MKQILILGAGKSSSHLIQYLSKNVSNLSIKLTIIDRNTSLVPKKIVELQNVEVLEISTAGLSDFEAYIKTSFLTISMLPAFMHVDIAKLCLKHSSHLITPSYVTDEMKALDEEVKAKDLIFLNEMGLDPGIDHMSTMKIYDELSYDGGELYSYKSFTGGLVAKKSDTNPWHYKFSWNPRNVILAGQGSETKYKENSKLKVLQYEQLFKESESLQLSNGAQFDTYANRDSLKYEELYDWKNVTTLLRGTLRYAGFCEAWAILVSMGLTNDDENLDHIKGVSYRDFYSKFYEGELDKFLAQYSEEIQEKLISIGFKDADSKIETDGSPAQILESILKLKWKLKPTDTDWIVMVHLIEYKKGDKKYQIESCLSLEGEDSKYTAMSKTVGLPMALATELILRGEYDKAGVQIPVDKQLYRPVLNSLKSFGVVFEENIKELKSVEYKN